MLICSVVCMGLPLSVNTNGIGVGLIPVMPELDVSMLVLSIPCCVSPQYAFHFSFAEIQIEL